MVNYRETTVNINGLTAVEFDRVYPYYEVRNDGEETIYISSARSDCPPGGDGVISVLAGSSVTIANTSGRTVYLNGSGKALVTGKYGAVGAFKAAGKGGGGGSADYKNGDYGILAEYENEVIGAAEEVIV